MSSPNHAPSRVSVARAVQHATVRLSGIDCADCIAAIEAGVGRIAGVTSARASLVTQQLRVAFDAQATSVAAVMATVRALGYGAEPVAVEASSSAVRPEVPGCSQPGPQGFRAFVRTDRQAWSAGLAGLLVAIGAALAWSPTPAWVGKAALGGAVAIAGLPIARRGVQALLRARRLGMNFLMAVASLGALALGEWFEGALVVVLFALGEALEGFSLEHARGSLRALIHQTPLQARVIGPTGERMLAADDVTPGLRIAVRPGERIPADGRVVSGTSAVNEAAVTGEAALVAKGVGDAVFAASLNDAGYLEIVADQAGTDTTIAHVVRLVEQAEAARAPAQRFVDRFAAVYTPLVVAAAAGIALTPPLVFGEPWTTWVFRALVVLVVACPCALVISTPVAIAAALATSTRHGVLVKGGVYIDVLARVRAVAFDKTGTLTRGVPVVARVQGWDGVAEREVLRLAAALEQRSEHALARAIVHAARRNPTDGPWPDPTHLIVAAGRGIRGRLNGAAIIVGSPGFLAELGIATADADAQLAAAGRRGETPVLVARDGRLAGLITTVDGLRSEAAPMLRALRALGIAHRVMLTGDREATARALAASLDLTAVEAQASPEAKVALIRRLAQASKPVAMVGDGINDTPALAAADVGIAMGAAGTAAALETADVALMGDDLSRIPEVLALSRRTLRTIRINVAVALGSKAVFLGLAVVGISSLWMAVAADMGASLAVTLFALRLLRHRWHARADSATSATAQAPAPASGA